LTIRQHFGRARYYVVLTIQNNEISAREKREKLGHAQFSGETHAEGNDPRGHGYDPAAPPSRHARMASAIADCQVLLARGTLAPHASAGVGAGAYDSLRAAGIRPIVTDIAKIDDAVKAYLMGTLVDHTERLH